MIVGINFVFKQLLLKLVLWQRMKTETGITNNVFHGVFIASFLNTAILMVLNEANFDDFDAGNGYLSWVFSHGSYTDFSQEWYGSVGNTLIKTMIFSAYFPIIEFCGFWCLKQAMRLWDRGLTSNELHTKRTSSQMYAELYSGPDYLVHYRFSTILLNVAVAFMYGTAMPMLYPIACFAFVVLLINERILICYYYKQPPAFSEEITVATLDMAKYCALLALPIAFWQIGNR